MKHELGAKIVGTGRAVPENTLTNEDLEKMVDTSDEWIRERTGMKVRHIAEPGVDTSDLATRAAENAMAAAGVTATEIDVIILATITADVQFPSTACYVQQKIGAVNAAAFDIAAACSGFIYGLQLANSMFLSGKYKNILVIGAEVLSRITDYTDRNTCVLFGDGAGAVLLQPTDGQSGIIDTYIKSDGRLSHLLIMPGGGTRNPATYETIDQRMNYIKMEGREVFKSAVTAMGDAATHILKENGLTGKDIQLLITHQANNRIIEATARRVKISKDKVYSNVEHYGNTSAASIPIALDEAIRDGRLKRGDKCMLVAFGGGFTWGSAIVQM
ncbi:ketoacyl-ACP synthase III [candidate division KSB1 bacterium]|nr:ketoacyl-ACP synthase III [candidate division KSB1 bacterium]